MLQPEAPISLKTFGDLLRHGYRLTCHCRPCGRHDEMDLAKLPADRRYVGAKFKCRECGGSVSITVTRIAPGNEHSIEALERWRGD
jgi:ribosomal protein S14